MLTKSELFWRLFQTSGQIGVYLLYANLRRGGEPGFSLGSGGGGEGRRPPYRHPAFHHEREGAPPADKTI